MPHKHRTGITIKDANISKTSNLFVFIYDKNEQVSKQAVGTNNTTTVSKKLKYLKPQL